jgi:nitrogen fixation protein FixH
MRRAFTGRHMLAIMLAFFGVVVAVNMLMATLAARTFGGTVVDNSYVASQKFNSWLAEGRAQERLGWRAETRVDGDRRIVVTVADRGGALAGAQVRAVARHPLGRAPDVELGFRAGAAGSYVSLAPLPAGRWLVHLEVRRGGRDLRMIENLT